MHVSKLLFGTKFSTLPPTPNWSPDIFTLVQKVKIGHKKCMLI